MASSAFVDSASPGRNERGLVLLGVGELAAAGSRADDAEDRRSSQAAATIHFARRPDARVRSFDMGPFPRRRVPEVNRNEVPVRYG